MPSLTQQTPPRRGSTKFRPKPLSGSQKEDRFRQLREAQRRQLEGIESQDIFKASIEAKLIEERTRQPERFKDASWFANFQRCGVESFDIMCEACGIHHEAHYQCSQKWCPRCNWRITSKRRELLEVVTRGMYRVKHVVLTQKNFTHLTTAKIRESRKALLSLRRQKVFGTVTGGCASMEFTNEGNGWHMHWHLLIQSDFINGEALAIAWGKLVGQEFAIVKVKAVTEGSYLQEVSKYVVEGSEIAKWAPTEILEFILALRGTRLFTTFGVFKDIAKFARTVIKLRHADGRPCECGATGKIFGTDEQMTERIWRKMFSG